MQEKTKKLIIIGAGEFAEIAYEYFTHDSQYEVVAFSVNKEYRTKQTLYNLPVVDFENLHLKYSPLEFEVFVAITYVQLNRIRTKMYYAVKERGFVLASYISSKAFVWHNAQIGENTFIFENNVIQHNVKIGNNVILWSGNHIGHRSVIEDHCWITSHCVISGFCHIGNSSFLGVNSTLGDNVHLADDTVLGASSTTVKSLNDRGSVYIGSPAKKIHRTAYEQFGVFDFR